MKNVTSLLIFVLLLSFSFVHSQKISDGETLDLNGLSVTFNILNKESVTVGGKTLTDTKCRQIWSTILQKALIYV